MRLFLSAAMLALLLASVAPVKAATSDEIITEATAQRFGLTRAWLTQAQVNSGQGRIRDVVLHEGILYVQTTRATLEAIDGETGQKLWSKLVGRPEHPSTPPGVYRDLVATINGSRLYVLNRYNGDLVYETTVNGAPGGGPALSSTYAYVPMVTGMILAYRLEPVVDAAKDLGKINTQEMTEDEKKEAAQKAEEDRRLNIRIRQDYVPALASQSAGRALVQPLVTTQNRDEEFCTWVTDRGYLHVGRIDRRSKDGLIVKYRLGAGAMFSNPPAFLPPDSKVVGDSGVVYASSSDGYIYAILERGGELLWKFSAAEPAIDSPVVIEDRVYATTELGGMFCLHAKSGKQIWWAADILHFVAAGKHRIYAADKLGRLRILDAKTGSTIDSLQTTALPVKVCNTETDRIYLGTDGGLLQCLHEVESRKPVVWNESRKPPPEEEVAAKPAPKGRPKAGEDGAPAPRPVAHKPVPKKPKDEGGFGDAGAGGDAAPADKPAPKPKAGGARPKAGAKGKAAADAAGG